MWNYHPDVVVETFVRFHPRAGRSRCRSCSTTTRSSSRPTTRSSRPRCSSEACPTQARYDKSKLLQIACVSPGAFDAAVTSCGGRVRSRAHLGHRMNDRLRRPRQRSERRERSERARSGGIMTDPWDDAGRSQAGFVVTAAGCACRSAAPDAARRLAGDGGAHGEPSCPRPEPRQRTEASGRKAISAPIARVREQVCEQLLLDPYLDASASS